MSKVVFQRQWRDECRLCRKEGCGTFHQCGLNGQRVKPAPRRHQYIGHWLSDLAAFRPLTDSAVCSAAGPASQWPTNTRFKATDRQTNEQTEGQRHRVENPVLWRRLNPLDSKGNYSATSNNTKLVHWPLMANVNGQCIPITVLLYDSPLFCGFNVAVCDVYVGGKVRVSEFMIFLDLQHCGSK